MYVRVEANAQEILGEVKLLQRLKLKSKADFGAVLSTIAVKDRAGAVRLIISIHADSEASSAVRLLTDSGFFDELIVDRELVDEDGSVECFEDVVEHPEFDSIYSLGPRRPVRSEAPKHIDPGPDPSWPEFRKA